MTAAGLPKPASTAATEPRPIAVVRSYSDLREAISAWCASIHMTRAELDADAGLTDGHSGKLLSRREIKKFGNVTLGRVLAAVGLVLILAQEQETPSHASSHASQPPPPPQHWRTSKGSSWGRRMGSPPCAQTVCRAAQCQCAQSSRSTMATAAFNSSS